LHFGEELVNQQNILAYKSKEKTCQNLDAAADYSPMDEHELKFLQTN
jgi:hypothetical protein